MPELQDTFHRPLMMKYLNSGTLKAAIKDLALQERTTFDQCVGMLQQGSWSRTITECWKAAIRLLAPGTTDREVDVARMAANSTLPFDEVARMVNKVAEDRRSSHPDEFLTPNSIKSNCKVVLYSFAEAVHEAHFSRSGNLSRVLLDPAVLGFGALNRVTRQSADTIQALETRKTALESEVGILKGDVASLAKACENQRLETVKFKKQAESIPTLKEKIEMYKAGEKELKKKLEYEKEITGDALDRIESREKGRAEMKEAEHGERMADLEGEFEERTKDLEDEFEERMKGLKDESEERLKLEQRLKREQEKRRRVKKENKALTKRNRELDEMCGSAEMKAKEVKKAKLSEAE